jgi:hypothetical protein
MSGYVGWENRTLAVRELLSIGGADTYERHGWFVLETLRFA